MTITINEGCESVTLVSDYLDADNQSVDLKLKINCETEYAVNYDVALTELEVTPESLESTELVLIDGVYYFELTIIQENGDKVVESGCKFINCSSSCLMLETFKLASQGDEEAMVKSMAFHALTLANDCASCSCTEMCALYEATQLEPCTTDVKPCGCS